MNKEAEVLLLGKVLLWITPSTILRWRWNKWCFTSIWKKFFKVISKYGKPSGRRLHKNKVVLNSLCNNILPIILPKFWECNQSVTWLQAVDITISLCFILKWRSTPEIRAIIHCIFCLLKIMEVPKTVSFNSSSLFLICFFADPFSVFPKFIFSLHAEIPCLIRQDF